MKYNASIIRGYARDLEDSAQSTIALNTIIGMLLGLASGAGFGMLVNDAEIGTLAVIVLGATGGVFGYATGQRKALRIRALAHLMLGVAEIERSTHREDERQQKDVDAPKGLR